MAFKVGSSKICSDLQFCSSPCSSFSSIGLTLSLVPLAAPNTACQHSDLSGDGENLTSRGSFFQVRMFSQKPSAKLSLARSGSHANLQINFWWETEAGNIITIKVIVLPLPTKINSPRVLLQFCGEGVQCFGGSITSSTPGTQA